MDYIKSEPLDERMSTVRDSGSTACPINVDHKGSANAAVKCSTEAVHDGSDDDQMDVDPVPTDMVPARGKRNTKSKAFANPKAEAWQTDV
jgi:hypothetical protein